MQETVSSNYLMTLVHRCLKLKRKHVKGEGLKILTPKQIFQKFPIALAQVKAGNTPKNLLNEIPQMYCLYVSSKRNY